MPLVSDTEATPASEPEAQTPPVVVDQASDAVQAADGTEGSSPSDAKEAPKSLLDVVKNAIEPAAEAPGDTSTPEPEKSEAKSTTEGEQELSEEDLAKLPFGKHPRFKQLLSQRNTAVQQAAEFETRVKDLQGPADQYVRIETFLRKNNIEPDDFTGLMKFGALLKNDPEAARKDLLQVLFDLDKATGQVLADDLRKDVEEGRITEDRARELSQTRAREARSADQARAERERADTVTRETETGKAIQAIASAVTDWEARTKAKDPDFAAKDKLVADRVRAQNAAEGMPASPEAAVERVQQAYDAITAHLRGLMPSKPAITRAPESSPSATVAAAPKSLKDAIQGALRVAT